MAWLLTWRVYSTAGGEMVEIYCTVLRCREVAGGWYEGALYFNREQAVFSAEEMQGL